MARKTVNLFLGFFSLFKRCNVNMVIKKLWRKIKGNKKEYANRFLKFYHENKARLNKERRGSYKKKQRDGICVRCNKKALKKIVFCSYHRKKQQEYNKKARSK
jgi:hypothetical protein